MHPCSRAEGLCSVSATWTFHEHNKRRPHQAPWLSLGLIMEPVDTDLGRRACRCFFVRHLCCASTSMLPTPTGQVVWPLHVVHETAG